MEVALGTARSLASLDTSEHLRAGHQHTTVLASFAFALQYTLIHLQADDLPSC